MVETNVNDVLSQIEFIQKKDMIDDWVNNNIEVDQSWYRYRSVTHKGICNEYTINKDYSVDFGRLYIPHYDTWKKEDIPFRINKIKKLCFNCNTSSDITKEHTICDNVYMVDIELNIPMYIDVSNLPKRITILKIKGNNKNSYNKRAITKITGTFSKSLKSLLLDDTGKTDIVLPKHLKSLDFYSVKRVDFNNLPEGVTSLYIESSEVPEILNLPPMLKDLFLQDLKNVKILKFPETLKSLNISKCNLDYKDIKDILPKGLVDLHIQKKL